MNARVILLILAVSGFAAVWNEDDAYQQQVACKPPPVRLAAQAVGQSAGRPEPSVAAAGRAVATAAANNSALIAIAVRKCPPERSSAKPEAPPVDVVLPLFSRQLARSDETEDLPMPTRGSRHGGAHHGVCDPAATGDAMLPIDAEPDGFALVKRLLHELGRQAVHIAENGGPSRTTRAATITADRSDAAIGVGDEIPLDSLWIFGSDEGTNRVKPRRFARERASTLH